MLSKAILAAHDGRVGETTDVQALHRTVIRLDAEDQIHIHMVHAQSTLYRGKTPQLSDGRSLVSFFADRLHDIFRHCPHCGIFESKCHLHIF
jgi:hypothetical protein